MSLNSTVSLGALRLQAINRADLENSPIIPVPAWNQYISQSYKRLYDKLVGAYGNDYYVAPPYQFSLSGNQFYPLPGNLYKLLGVDLQYSGSPSGYVSLRNFEFIERNKYAYPNTTINTLGYTNLKYRLSGNNIEFIPIPAGVQTAQLWFIPKPTNLQFLVTCGTTLLSPTLTTTDATDISVGMSVSGPGIPINTTVLSVNTTVTPNTITMSNQASSTQAVATLPFWIDSVTMDGIAGWEEYIIVDAAIKAKVKQDFEVGDLRIMKQEMDADIAAMAEGRDAGQAFHTSDALTLNGYGYDGLGDGGGGWEGY